tara:strand:+ start:561 stop:2306 length:1746 start_codon:yes stop_codon:yes gene_type:complete
MMPNRYPDTRTSSYFNPGNHQVSDSLGIDETRAIHEADGIYYDGDIDNFKWQMRILPGCEVLSLNAGLGGFSLGGRSFSSFSKQFFQSLNVSDIIYSISTIASYTESSKKLRYSYQGAVISLAGSLVAVLQDRLLIITDGKKIKKIEIPYSDIKTIDEGIVTLAGSFKFEFINIKLADGNKIKCYLTRAGMVEHGTHLRKRVASWIRKKMGTVASSSIDEPKLEYQWSVGRNSSDEESSYDNLSIKDLKGILRKRGLSVGGKSDNEEEYKLELIARLKGQGYDFSLEPWTSTDKTFYDLKPIDEKDIPEIINLQNKYKSKHPSDFFSSQKPESPAYPMILSILLVVLFFMFLSSMYDIWRSGIYDDNIVIYSDNQVWFNRLFIFSGIFIMVFLKWKTETLQLNVRPDFTTIISDVSALVVAFSVIIWFVGWMAEEVAFQALSSVSCCSSLLILISIPIIFSSVKSRSEIFADEKERFYVESPSRRIRFDAIKCENHGYLDLAKKKWLEFENDDYESPYAEEVDRLERFEVEIEYVRVKRRILGLKDKGIICEKLENNILQSSRFKNFGFAESSDTMNEDSE